MNSRLSSSLEDCKITEVSLTTPLKLQVSPAFLWASLPSLQQCTERPVKVWELQAHELLQAPSSREVRRSHGHCLKGHNSYQYLRRKVAVKKSREDWKAGSRKVKQLIGGGSVWGHWKEGVWNICKVNAKEEIVSWAHHFRGSTGAIVPGPPVRIEHHGRKHKAEEENHSLQGH